MKWLQATYYLSLDILSILKNSWRKNAFFSFNELFLSRKSLLQMFASYIVTGADPKESPGPLSFAMNEIWGLSALFLYSQSKTCIKNIYFNWKNLLIF